MRFNLDNNTDIGITFSDKSSSEEELVASDRNTKADDIINVKITPSKSRFTVAPVLEPISRVHNLKLVKPDPKDLIRPKLTLNRSSDSEEDTRSLDKVAINTIDSLFDSDNSESSPDEKINKLAKKLEERAEKKVGLMKQNIWEEKNEEVVKFQSDIENSHKEELNRLLTDEQTKFEAILETELEKLRKQMDVKNSQTLKEEESTLAKKLDVIKSELELSFKDEETKLKLNFEAKKEELEKYYEEKLAETEKELADRVDKNKEELLYLHNANVDQLKQNHSIIIEELKREFKVEVSTYCIYFYS